MNLFTICDNPKACVQALDDILLRKTVLEAAQMISTAIRLNNKIDIDIPDDILYKVYNAGEEHNTWVRETQKNYRWTYYYLMEALAEYEYRFGKQHDAKKIALVTSKYEPYFPKGDMTPFPRKFNKDYPNYHELMEMENTYEAYRKYLITKWNADSKEEDKRKIPVWTKRDKPEFYEESKDDSRTFRRFM